MKRFHSILLLAAAMVTIVIFLPTSPSQAAVLAVELVSVNTQGMQGNDNSRNAHLSADGRYVTFESDSDGLVPVDNNGLSDIYVRDRWTGTLELVSVAHDGSASESGSYRPQLSADGRYVVFSSGAANLIPDDTNDESDIFLHDRQTQVTTLVSLAANGEQVNDSTIMGTISADGRYIAYSSRADNIVAEDTNGHYDIYVYDRQTVVTVRASVDSSGNQADLGSSKPIISADGRYVAFSTMASNLVVGDTNARNDIFVHDLHTGITERVSVNSAGVQANDHSRDPVISADGRIIAFGSDASNLAPGDNNDKEDVFVFDRDLGITTRISVDNNGNEGSLASGLPSISGDGRFITFQSAVSLVPQDSGLLDVYVYDRMLGTVALVSEAVDGTSSNNHSSVPAISADGRYVAFHSFGTDFGPIDTNEELDVYLVRQEVITRTHPANGQVMTVSNAEDWPRFTFQHLDGLDWYQIWIGTADYSQTHLYTWYPAFDSSPFAQAGQSICDEGTGVCTLPQDIWLENGDYTWWMTGWSEGDTMETVNANWEEAPFSVDFAVPQNTIKAEADGEASGLEIIELQRDVQVFWYHIWVGPVDYSQTSYHEWINATTYEGCDAQRCIIDVSDLAFPDGEYEIWVEVWGPGGYLTFTDILNNPHQFTVPIFEG